MRFLVVGAGSWGTAFTRLLLDRIGVEALEGVAMLAGTWLGFRLFGRLNEASFRKVVLVLLLASGIVLVV